MAQFDLYRNPADAGYLVDCQSDYLDIAETRFAVPLLPIIIAPQQMVALNPMMEIDGEPHVLATQFASAVRLSLLGRPIGSLMHRRYDILRALDVLIGGF